MSLSTSSSDGRAWGRWLATFVGMSALGACVTFALVILIDPYDSGRFGLIGIKGIRRRKSTDRECQPRAGSTV